MSGRIGLDYPRAVLILLAVMTVLALVVIASTSNAAFGAYNRGWDGAADLRSVAEDAGAETALVRNTSAYDDTSPNETIAVILSPDTAYSDAEAARIRRFVERGGTLVVAEDFGQWSNELLADLGAAARFDGRLLRDERYYYRSPSMAIARNVSQHNLTASVDQVTLNYGTAVRSNGATILASTSEYAYLDTNRNDKLDDAEHLGTYPVVTVESIDEGRIIAVSDPSILINVMLDRLGNRALVRNLFAGHKRVLLDYSHAAGFPPLALVLLVLRETPSLQVVIGGLGVTIIGLWVARGIPARVRRLAGTESRLREPGVTEAEMAAFIRNRYPGWDEDRVRRVIQGIINRHDESRGND